MRLPYSIRSKINTRFLDHAPSDYNTRKDWKNYEGHWTCDDGHYKIVSDEKLGLVIAEIKNVNYTAKSSL